jgi:hypothetical protein
MSFAAPIRFECPERRISRHEKDGRKLLNENSDLAVYLRALRAFMDTAVTKYERVPDKPLHVKLIEKAKNWGKDKVLRKRAEQLEGHDITIDWRGKLGTMNCDATRFLIEVPVGLDIFDDADDFFEDCVCIHVRSYVIPPGKHKTTEMAREIFPLLADFTAKYVE